MAGSRDDLVPALPRGGRLPTGAGDDLNPAAPLRSQGNPGPNNTPNLPVGGTGGINASSIDDLSNAGTVPDPRRPNFTKAGGSLSKHGQGKRAGNSKFPAPKGNPSKINQTEPDQLNELLTDPGTIAKKGYRGRFGKTLEVEAPDGRGVVFNEAGDCLFFKE